MGGLGSLGSTIGSGAKTIGEFILPGADGKGIFSNLLGGGGKGGNFLSNLLGGGGEGERNVLADIILWRS